MPLLLQLSQALLAFALQLLLLSCVYSIAGLSVDIDFSIGIA